MELTLVQILVRVSMAVIALGIVNVWLVRAGRPSGYRGGSAKTLREEFQVYGLPSWAMPVVGGLKLAFAAMLVLRLFNVPAYARIGAIGIAVLMVGAIAMHVKVKDEWKKSLPAATMLVLSLFVAIALDL